MMTIHQAHEAMKKGELTPWDLAQKYLKNIEAKNKEINAYLEVYSDIKEQCEVAAARFKDGTATLLTGIPCAVKDNILIKGRKVSAASKILENYVATYDATAIEKFKKEGVVFLGRVNMDEFAMGGSTENSAYGPTRNPHDTSRVPGGTSGGSAAAVAMDGALISIGTDTGGSVRQPASFCGVVGLKPTYGGISRYGIIAMGSSLDQVGPIAHTVSDVEILFNTMKGLDPKDGTTILQKEIAIPKKLVVGIPDFPREGIHPDVLLNFNESVEKFEKLGYEIKEIKLPNIKYALAVYYVIMPAEVSSNMARFDGVKYGLHVDGKDGIDDYFVTRAQGLGKEVRRRILLGTYVLSSGYYDAYYNKANIVRELIRGDFKKAFESVDVILTPTAPTPAFKIGEKTADPLQMYLEDIFTVTANLTGNPAMSIPSGFSGKLPIGIQMTARHGEEAVLFAVGKKFLGEDKV